VAADVNKHIAHDCRHHAGATSSGNAARTSAPRSCHLLPPFLRRGTSRALGAGWWHRLSTTHHLPLACAAPTWVYPANARVCVLRISRANAAAGASSIPRTTTCLRLHSPAEWPVLNISPHRRLAARILHLQPFLSHAAEETHCCLPAPTRTRRARLTAHAPLRIVGRQHHHLLSKPPRGRSHGWRRLYLSGMAASRRRQGHHHNAAWRLCRRLRCCRSVFSPYLSGCQ